MVSAPASIPQGLAFARLSLALAPPRWRGLGPWIRMDRHFGAAAVCENQDAANARRREARLSRDFDCIGLRARTEKAAPLQSLAILRLGKLLERAGADPCDVNGHCDCREQPERVKRPFSDAALRFSSGSASQVPASDPR